MQSKACIPAEKMLSTRKCLESNMREHHDIINIINIIVRTLMWLYLVRPVLIWFYKSHCVWSLQIKFWPLTYGTDLILSSVINTVSWANICFLTVLIKMWVWVWSSNVRHIGIVLTWCWVNCLEISPCPKRRGHADVQNHNKLDYCTPFMSGDS